jgi:anti-sigma-K factor RskA
LTAPDLIRFNLTSGATVDRSSAQLLWSRTRGLVLSASRLPAAPPEATYQLWLKTSAESVSAGVFVPDETGRATLVADFPPKVMGPVVGAEVTVEPKGGRPAPSGPTLLYRLIQS